ncbi:uncharacterized protein LOC142987835 [Anticarsia gemmatalis]|uniref:uncharacterized protein LOC142987835 n=1 Tax=Anticarsia gemmatalis TaxID=129554 RepID=UPI003F76AF24
MSKTDCPGGCGPGGGGAQRFKGVENFLKRIAFNLGNTPSQTEVKIISCIPIDVSDLQQKIINLEKQLEDSRAGRSPMTASHKKTVNTAICSSKFPKMSNTAVACNSLDMDRSTSTRVLAASPSIKNRSNTLFKPSTSFRDLPSVSSRLDDVPPIPTIKTNLNSNRPYRRYLEIMDGIKPFILGEQKDRKSFFKKKKKCNKSKSSKSHIKNQNSPYIYYAQTNNSPFGRYTTNYVDRGNDVVTRSYLEDVIKRQYQPRPLVGKFSNTSRFSSPVCRDAQECTIPLHYESDVCSCCHGQFQNIDNHMSDSNIRPYRVNKMNTEGGYYDSALYDVIPVKEKPFKAKKSPVLQIRPTIDIKCWPEHVRTKLRTYPMYNPLYFDRRDPRLNQPINLRTVPKISRKAPTPRHVWKARKEIRNTWPVGITNSKSCSINLGSVYPKVLAPKTPEKGYEPAIVPLKTDAECLTTIINDSECQTTSSNDNYGDKTEATLNQIKSILQSVLQEVKVTSLTKSSASDQSKKGSTIHKEGSGPCAMQGSRLLSSFTYSPYNINPYMPSCSKQMTSNQYYYPPSPMKCVQNFPLFIQTPGRHMCSSCYRNNSPLKPSYVKPATTIATNTDVVKEATASKETEKLIKEIYKSMALSMGVPNKNISSSDFENVKSVHTVANDRSSRKVVDKPESVKEVNKGTDVEHIVSELYRKRNTPISSETQNTTIDSGVTMNELHTRSRSDVTGTDIEARLRKERLEKYLAQTKHAYFEDDRKQMVSQRRRIENTTTSMTESDVESSDTDTDATCVPDDHKHKQKKQKSSLFSKVFNSVRQGFKTRSRRKQDKEKKLESAESDEDASSDSDDYQTIYSQKIEKAPKTRAQTLPKRRTHSKVSYKQTYQRDRSPEKTRLPPYMEQEYRRQWNEKFMFQERYNDTSANYRSDQRRPPYYQTYEARPTIVDTKTTDNSKNPRGFASQENIKAAKPGSKLPAKGLAWFKKRKIACNCGEQWKKFLLEN